MQRNRALLSPPVAPGSRAGQRPATDDLAGALPHGWWILPFSGLGLCLWAGLACVLIGTQ